MDTAPSGINCNGKFERKKGRKRKITTKSSFIVSFSLSLSLEEKEEKK